MWSWRKAAGGLTNEATSETAAAEGCRLGDADQPTVLLRLVILLHEPSLEEEEEEEREREEKTLEASSRPVVGGPT